MHHKNMGHVGKEPKPPNEGTVTAMKAERHRKSVDERIDELYKLSLAGCKIALDGKDTRGLASCIAQGIAATELMGKPDSRFEQESDGYLEAVKATAKNDWKDARPVQVASPEQKAADDAELVDA